MKCINCGGEIDGGTPFCPLCGAAQTAVEGSENVNNGQQTYGQSQQLPYMQQQAYENTSQQWQQPPYGQQQQLNQGYYQNNMQYPTKKKPKVLLTIALILFIVDLIADIFVTTIAILNYFGIYLF